MTDDEPAPMRDWQPYYAGVIGAKRPLRVPAWLATMVIGRGPVQQLTTLRGASNVKAKTQLGWQPRYASWRDGFATEFGRAAEEVMG